jgi:hypothetical protein
MSQIQQGTTSTDALAPLVLDLSFDVHCSAFIRKEQPFCVRKETPARRGIRIDLAVRGVFWVLPPDLRIC